MPVIKSAIKKMRQDIKRRRSNRAKKENLKTLIKTAQKTPTEKNIKMAISFMDKAVKTNLIHSNKAARLKSRLTRLAVKSSRSRESVKKAKSTTVKKRRSAKVVV